MKYLPVSMCGGSGTRVWPESRKRLPKQLIPLVGDLSTFQMEPLSDDVFETPIVTRIGFSSPAPAGHQAHGADRARARFWNGGRNRGDARGRLGGSRRQSLLALCAAAAREGHIVVLGIKPDHAATRPGCYMHKLLLPSLPGRTRCRVTIKEKLDLRLHNVHDKL